jgi:putative membrane protein
MIVLTKALILIMILLHFYFMILEMFFWTKPAGRKAFGMSLDQAESSKKLAANQGLYNGFLSAGLLWGLLDPRPFFGISIQIFFLSCIVTAGVFGAWTVHRKIFWIQAFPAILALIALSFAWPWWI